jgi:hypothetical protein
MGVSDSSVGPVTIYKYPNVKLLFVGKRNYGTATAPCTLAVFTAGIDAMVCNF